MRLSNYVQFEKYLRAYGCPCNDGKTGQDYANLLSDHGYKGNTVGDKQNEGTALRRESSTRAGTSGHVVEWNADSGAWNHEDPQSKETKGIGYAALKQHLDEVHGKKAA